MNASERSFIFLPAHHAIGFSSTIATRLSPSGDLYSVFRAYHLCLVPAGNLNRSFSFLASREKRSGHEALPATRCRRTHLLRCSELLLRE